MSYLDLLEMSDRGRLFYELAIYNTTVASKLFSSSNLALTSNKTETCFPFSAAFNKVSITLEFLAVLYKVILMDNTFGSSEAIFKKLITGSNELYGWCKNTSFIESN